MNKALSVSGILSCLLLSLLIIYGCGGGGGGGDGGGGPTTLTGSFIDSPVAGVEYETNTQSGITDSQGTFKYQSGETVSFYIGGVFLGSSQGQAVITPVDLVDGATDIFHPAVTNIARLLQSLDEDENPDNGIYISESTANLLQQKDIDITDPNLDFDNNIEIHGLLSEIGNIPVTANEAQLHLLKDLGENDTGLAQELANAVPWHLKSIDNVDAYAIGGILTMTSSTFTYTNNMTCTESGSYFINDGKYIATITSLSGNCGDDFVGEVTYSDYFFDTDTFGIYIDGELWLFENFEDDNDTELAQELANAGPWYLKSIDNVDASAIGGKLTMTTSTFTFTNNLTCTEKGSFTITSEPNGKYIATITSITGDCGDDFVGEVTYSDYFFDTDTFGIYIDGELWLFENFEDEDGSENLIGTWTISLPDMTAEITFNSDNTCYLDIINVCNVISVCSITGNILTVEDIGGTCPCDPPEHIGTFSFSIIDNEVNFQVINDDCTGRKKLGNEGAWTRQ